MSRLIDQQYDYLFKLVLIGDSGVGKTNILSRFNSNQFTLQSRPTIGVQFATKTVSIADKKIKTQIWDTAGQQRFRAITHAYYRGATGALIVYDITKQNTFDNIDKWLKQLKQNADSQIVIILIGNKSDMRENRVVKQQQASKYASDHSLFFMQTSAMEAVNIDNAFRTVIQQIYKKINRQQSTEASSKPKLSKFKQVADNTKVETNQNEKISLNEKDKKKDKKSCC